MRSAKRTFYYKMLAAIFLGALLFILSFQLWLLFNRAQTSSYYLNESINQRNTKYASQNLFGFTDRPRVIQKPKGVFRIAVIGDSFIWGSGLPYEKTWSHKLESKLLAEYDSIEIMSWGKCGWSTLDELNFYRQHGKEFGPDLLIIGWVDNDPDVGKIPQVRPNAQKDHPWLYKLSPALAQKFENSSSEDAYNNWISQIYASKNLKYYQAVLDSFSVLLANNSTRALVVMTPSALDEGEQSHFNQVEPIIRGAGFNCLNIYTDVKLKLGQYDKHSLRANPANGHPGELMTEVFADDVKNYLEQKGYLTLACAKQQLK